MSVVYKQVLKHLARCENSHYNLFKIIAAVYVHN